ARAAAVNHDKGERDVVTDIDLAIEKYLISELKLHFPSDNIVSEEFNGDNVLNGRTWTIDPIDGTINFSKGSFLFGFQIALLDGVKPMLSYIFLPDLDNKFMAVEGEGAYLNDERIYIKNDCPLEKAIVSIGSFSNSNKELADYEFELVKMLQQKVLGIRMFGTGAFDCASVAASFVQAHFMFATHVWDVAPGALLCKEAGAIVTKVDGSEYDVNYPSYLFSSNKEIADYFADCAAKLPKLDFMKFKK
ncbi:MAG: inositol monophosphatase, partial [Clostridia bacterium]